MRVLVACLEDKSFEFKGNAGQLNQSATWPYFWMPCVMGDDYLQRANCLVEAVPVDVRLLDGCMFVLYQARKDAEAFAAWIPDALAAVEHGYRTMRG
ncbi:MULTISPECIES: hypothetical protein [Ramlibacter]|uniref:Uncharacterized protein n=1 Tax=Ramlibacter pinisoli TaxID=2682844 RepID=A0A6N8IS28_9BURK|nr:MULTISPECIES: hypothetical protein [Ramlibacter]MBA2964682.1 hypothetical protein [Ramlibacter sp. CGMCC 1.13660]MVQ29647.1 hypothetical protein [Ramlibacter pinisoli]